MAGRSRSLSPREAVRRFKTRDQVRKYLLAELPGWDDWLTGAAASVQAVGWDRQMLRLLDDLLDDVARMAREWVEAVGRQEAESKFLPFAQVRSYLSRELDYPAVAEITPLNERYYQGLVRWLGDRHGVPSPTFIGLLGAVGIVAARGTGRRRDLRLDAACDWVGEALLPFVKSSVYTGPRAGTPVLPDRYADPDFPPERARIKVIPMALAALVAKYLSLPNRKDVELDAELRGTPAVPERVDFGGQVLDQAYELLKQRARAAARRDEEIVIDPLRFVHDFPGRSDGHPGRDVEPTVTEPKPVGRGRKGRTRRRKER